MEEDPVKTTNILKYNTVSFEYSLHAIISIFKCLLLQSLSHSNVASSANMHSISIQPFSEHIIAILNGFMSADSDGLW